MIKLQRKGFRYKMHFENFTVLITTYLYIILLNLNKFLNRNNVCTCFHASVFNTRHLNKSKRKLTVGHLKLCHLLKTKTNKEKTMKEAGKQKAVLTTLMANKEQLLTVLKQPFSLLKIH